jgi:hypothetical protein
MFAVLAWNRRWMSDDGLIVLRTVRQILTGNGPVFNAGERVESNTSTLRTYLLVAFGGIPGLRLEWLAVILGLLCSLGGLLLALDRPRRLIDTTRPTLVVPAGALVLIALLAFRDFATSGLETGLITLWPGTTWWLLVRHARRTPACPVTVTALVVGLGVLVRPDLALFSVFALWIPLLLCAALGAMRLWRTRIDRAVAIVVAVPLLSGIALALYVLRVGGDFTHGRMLLPALFSLLLPVLARHARFAAASALGGAADGFTVLLIARIA